LKYLYTYVLQKNECVKNIHKLMWDMSKQHGDNDTMQFVNKLLSDGKNKVGLLINERYLNIPPSISVPLFRSIRYYYIYLINAYNIILYFFTLLTFVSTVFIENAHYFSMQLVDLEHLMFNFI